MLHLVHDPVTASPVYVTPEDLPDVKASLIAAPLPRNPAMETPSIELTGSTAVARVRALAQAEASGERITTTWGRLLTEQHEVGQVLLYASSPDTNLIMRFVMPEAYEPLRFVVLSNRLRITAVAEPPDKADWTPIIPLMELRFVLDEYHPGFHDLYSDSIASQHQQPPIRANRYTALP